MLTYADHAELFEALKMPGAAHFRESAQHELADERERLQDQDDRLDALEQLLDEVPEPAASTKHGDTCWQRHARCLADRILDRELR